MEHATNPLPILVNREISWLQFNERVLQEATDPRTPLIERLRFLGIYSNNRDEFFRVRVATMKRLTNIDKLDYKVKFDPNEILRDIYDSVYQQEEQFNSIYRSILNDLAKENIMLINERDLDDEQGAYVRDYFYEHLRNHLNPLMLDNVIALNSLRDKSLYLLVELFSSDPKIKNAQALVRVPVDIHSRFLILPSQGDKTYLILLDDVVRYCISDVFSVIGYDHFQAYTIKFTRDAELDIDNDVSKSFLEIMSESIKQRDSGEPVRFVYEDTISASLLKKLIKKLKISKTDSLRSGGRYHNFKDFMGFPKLGDSRLSYPPMPPLDHPGISRDESLFTLIRQKDIMLHFPYQSFNPILDLLREASVDPRVRSIKMTFYRVARDSKVMHSLINAARNGKKVSVFLEIQARFDEEANIYWAGKLQAEGARVIPSIPGYKVHSKLILIKRKEGNKERFYANISTGNFNESTAKVYADDSLLTANQKIAGEVDKVFDLMETRYNLPSFNNLIVSPFHTRNFFIEKIDTEIRNKEMGKDAWVILKLNSLVDKKIIKKLYEASQKGVKIQLIVRGICVLVPGVEGLSDNIEAFSIVDKYLEHSRVYIFCNDNDNRYYTGSADWMQRNFDHRIEVTTPILDKDVQKELRDMIDIQMKDNCKSRYISKDKTNQYRDFGKEKVRAQFAIYDYFKKKLRPNNK